MSAKWIVGGVVIACFWILLVVLGRSSPTPAARREEPVDTTGVVVFQCPAEGCEVARDMETEVALLLYRHDAPGDDGMVDSASRRKMYTDALTRGKLFTVSNATVARRMYETPVEPASPGVRYSVVKILDGEHRGEAAVVDSRILR
jgi:hypothetical protein